MPSECGRHVNILLTITSAAANVMCDWLYILHYARAWFPIPGAHHCEGGVESGGESS
jgi:hypothetical protein